MARPGWYNENSGRDFPFVFGRDGSVNYDFIKDNPDIVVDFGCVIGIRGDFTEDEHSVWLSAIRKAGNQIAFEFYSDAPGLSQHKLVFYRELTDEDYEIEYAEAVLRDETSLSLSTSLPDVLGDDSYCRSDMLWEGFLVTKNVAKLADLFGGAGEGEKLFDSSLSVEPGLIQNLAQHYMSTLNVFNANRTRASRLEGCKPWCWPSTAYTSYGYFPVATCLTGDIRIAEGYNCFIEEDRYNNKLTIHAEVGQGLGEPNSEVPIFPGEGKPSYGSFYDGSVGCNEVVRSINGIEGPNMEIIGGQGITVEAVPGQHMILIGVSMQDLAGCFEQEASTSLTEITPDPDPCACGEE